MPDPDESTPAADDAAALLAEFARVDSAATVDVGLAPSGPVVDEVPAETQDDVGGGAGPAVGGENRREVRHVPDTLAWAYLGVLLLVFLGIVLFALAGDEGGVSPDSGVSSATIDSGASALAPSELVFVIDGASVTLTGSVPDEETRAQLLELAEARYGAGNVTDELVVDEGITLDGTTVSVRGSTVEGDELPEWLIADVIAAMNVMAGDFDVEFVAPESRAMDVEAMVSPVAARLRGSVPDQTTLDSLVSAATAVWGAGSVDASGLDIDGLVVSANGTVRLVGAVDAGDARAAAFAAAVGQALGVPVQDAIVIDTGAEALGRLEENLRAALAVAPILFVVGGADIDPQSDPVLRQVAATITAAPGVAVEIVGHTDDQGDAAANLVLSQARADAVLQRLAELGVDPTRLTARGAGGAEPVADNATEEGRTVNRRIAFEFEGAGEG